MRGQHGLMADTHLQQTDLQQAPPQNGHSPNQERPLGGYAVLTGSFLALTAGFAAWFRSSGRQLPDEVGNRDLLLGAVASFKASRVVTRDRVTSTIRAPFTRFQGDAGPSEVNEAARGRGLRRAIGEALVCPYCFDVWVASAYLAGLASAPRATRWIASGFALVSVADVLQIAYAKAEATL